MQHQNRGNDRGAIRSDVNQYRRDDAVGIQSDPKEHQTGDEGGYHSGEYGNGDTEEAREMGSGGVRPYDIENWQDVPESKQD